LSKRNGPPGYLSKRQAAERLGVSTKTVDRRLKLGDLHVKILRIGRSTWLLESDVEQYFAACKQRGYL